VIGSNGGRVVVCCVSTKHIRGEMKLRSVPDTLLGKWGKRSIHLHYLVRRYNDETSAVIHGASTSLPSQKAFSF